jgi:hypothetical protein
MSVFSIHLELVEDWPIMSDAFIASLQSGTYLNVRRVRDTFVVVRVWDQDFQASVTSDAVMKQWVLLTVQDKRLEVRFHHPPSTFAGNNKDRILAALESGIQRIVKDVNTRHLLRKLDSDRFASPWLIPEDESCTCIVFWWCCLVG